MFLASSVNVSLGSRKTPVFGGILAGMLSSLRVLLPRLRLACEGSSCSGWLVSESHELARAAMAQLLFSNSHSTMLTKWFYPTRLETRTKESNICASSRVLNLLAQ